MREIRFRIWDKEIKKMILIGPKWFINNKVFDDDFNKSAKKDHCVLMQYTGLKDQNGLEIYEGDIIQVDSDEIVEVVFITEKYGEVPESQLDNVTNAGFFTKDKDGYYSGILASISEVIGNIYENPELIK